MSEKTITVVGSAKMLNSFFKYLRYFMEGNPFPTDIGQTQTSAELPSYISSALVPMRRAKLLSTLDTKLLTTYYKSKLDIDVSACFSKIPHIGLYQCESSGLLQYFPVIVGSELFYAALQKFPWYYLDCKREFTVAGEYIDPTASVLEIGCGTGNFAVAYNLHNYTGLELNLSAVAAASAKGLHVLADTIENYAARHAGRHDVVCAFQVLEHVSAPQTFLKACLDVLKDGGKLILSTPSEDAFPRFVPNYVLNMPPHHVTRWTDKSLQSIGDVFALQNVQLIHMPLESIHDDHYCNSLALYQACRERSIRHDLIPLEILPEIQELAGTFLPDVRRILAQEKKHIMGHDVVSIFTKGSCRQVFPSTAEDDTVQYRTEHNAVNSAPQTTALIASAVAAMRQVGALVLVNLGCGARWRPGWINIDFLGDNINVFQHNLLQGVPLSDASVDAIYLSHCLEHFAPHDAEVFLHECGRVLKPSGILRVVVPDLEQTARFYLAEVDAVRANPANKNAAARHAWMITELIDQLCRHQSGGEMMKLWAQPEVPAEEFIVSRLGLEYLTARNYCKGREMSPPPTDPHQVGRFRLSGEPHQWMYDEFSLARLLQHCGLRSVRRVDAVTSALENFAGYHLDTNDDGTAYKPESLYMEAYR